VAYYASTRGGIGLTRSAGVVYALKGIKVGTGCVDASGGDAMQTAADTCHKHKQAGQERGRVHTDQTPYLPTPRETMSNDILLP
jgi:hypothetical protein